MCLSTIVPAAPRRRRILARGRGFTLVEIMVSLAILAISSMGGVAAFLTLNRYAANLRNLSEARALCQERIEQAQTMAFRPTATIVPMAPDADPTSTTKYNANTPPGMPILGAASTLTSGDPIVYNTTTGAFTGGANCQTSTENIPVYTQSDGTSANSSANVTYTRVTTVSPTTLLYPTKSTSLNIVRFTVTVSYVFHGQSYSMSMTTLRGPD